MSRCCAFFLVSAVFFASTANAQQATNINFNFTLGNDTGTRFGRYLGLTHATVNPFGIVALRTDVAQPQSTGNTIGTMSVVFNRLDSFDVSVNVPGGAGAKMLLCH